MSRFICNFNNSRLKRAACIISAALLSLSLISCGNTESTSAPSEKSDSVISLNKSFSQASPPISAHSAILIETEGGRVVCEKNADERLPMASTTKIMTALVAIESGDISRKVEIDAGAVGVEGSSVYLHEGERLTLEDLLYALMLESANDAATAIAIAVAGSVEDFSALMNAKARELGLENTSFANPHGLDSELHYTTARELAILAMAAMRNETFRKIVSTPKKTIPLNESEGVRLLVNHNKMLKGYEGAIGIKTGFTKKSGRCLVSAAERDGVQLICVTLNAPDDWKDHSSMLDFGFSLFESRLLCDEGKFSHTMPIVGGDKEYVILTNEDAIRVILPRNRGEIECTVELPQFVYAPVSQGEAVGKLVYSCQGEKIAEVDIIASYPSERIIYKKSFFDKLGEIFD